MPVTSTSWKVIFTLLQSGSVIPKCEFRLCYNYNGSENKIKLSKFKLQKSCWFQLYPKRQLKIFILLLAWNELITEKTFYLNIGKYMLQTILCGQRKGVVMINVISYFQSIAYFYIPKDSFIFHKITWSCKKYSFL